MDIHESLRQNVCVTPWETCMQVYGGDKIFRNFIDETCTCGSAISTVWKCERCGRIRHLNVMYVYIVSMSMYMYMYNALRVDCFSAQGSCAMQYYCGQYILPGLVHTSRNIDTLTSAVRVFCIGICI